MTIVVIASEAFELAGIANKLENKEKTALPFRFSCMGKWKGSQVICVADGPGFRIAGAVAERVINEFSPQALWSVGLCGALEKSLNIGDIVIGKAVIDPESNEKFELQPLGEKSGKIVTVVSQDRVAGSVIEKRNLRSYGEVVEMESAAIARKISSKNIAFSCIKAVSDTAEEEFGIDLNLARDQQGRFQAARILGESIRRPLKHFPELARLYRQSRYASGRLGEFIVNCRI